MIDNDYTEAKTSALQQKANNREKQQAMGEEEGWI